MQRLQRWLLLLLSLAVAPTCLGEKIVWAKGARHFGRWCPHDGNDCVLAYVPSPNRKRVAIVARKRFVLSIEILDGSKRYAMPIPGDEESDFWVETEILWSPDSTSISFAGNASAITWSSHIYAVTPAGLKSLDLHPVMADFVRAYLVWVTPLPADIAR